MHQTLFSSHKIFTPWFYMILGTTIIQLYNNKPYLRNITYTLMKIRVTIIFFSIWYMYIYNYVNFMFKVFKSQLMFVLV